MNHDDRQVLRQFEAEGYVILRGVIAPEIRAQVQAEMEALVQERAEKLLAQGLIQDPLALEPFTTRLYRLYAQHLDQAPHLFRGELHRAGLYPLLFHPLLLQLAQLLLGPEIRLYPNYSARPKLPGWDGTLVLWHQDGSYTGNAAAVADLRMVNLWSPLVPARVANGCMQFIPGTHKLGNVAHVKQQYYLEIARDILDPLLPRAVNIELDPGDVVLFHNLLFHCGLPNQAATIRWSLDWRYQDATQPTLRRQQGHLAASVANPGQIVATAQQWAGLTLS